MLGGQRGGDNRDLCALIIRLYRRQRRIGEKKKETESFEGSRTVWFEGARIIVARIVFSKYGLQMRRVISAGN